MPGPIISVSGLRGIIGETLDPSLAIRFVAAFASELEPGPIVVARDGRRSGPMLAGAILSGLNAAGRRVLYADVAATPTVGILIRQHDAAGGVQISASHNPPPYNGMKLLGSDGRVISATRGAAVQARFEHPRLEWAAYDCIGATETLRETTEHHVARVLATVDVERIRRRQFRVLLDANHGAGAVLARPLFEALGVDARMLGAVPDGAFEHPPEPTAANLGGVAAQAAESNAEVAFGQDPDADRLAIIDEQGRYIGEEYTLAIALSHRLRNQPGPVVVNCATSRMCMEIAESLGGCCYLSAVGEANVTARMDEVGAVYGGEGNGGPIDPRVGMVRDSFVGMAQTLDALAATGRSVSELIAELPHYVIHKTTLTLDPERVPNWLAELESHNREAQVLKLDGLRLDWPDRWLLVRPSNTEPIVRIIAEARHEAAAKGLCEMAARMAVK